MNILSYEVSTERGQGQLCPRLNDATGLRTSTVVLPALITVPKAERHAGQDDEVFEPRSDLRMGIGYRTDGEGPPLSE
jgi:hypothetical protein